MFPLDVFFFNDVLSKKQDKVRFQRNFYENVGWTHIEKDGAVYLAVNICGVSENDLEITIEPGEMQNQTYMVISGKTQNEIFDFDYSINKKFSFEKQIKKYGKKVENGLLILKVEFDKPVVPQIETYNL